MSIKQSGGGSWHEYCPLCMLPYSVDHWKNGDVYEPLPNVNVRWLSKELGFDETTHKIMNLNSYKL